MRIRVKVKTGAPESRILGLGEDGTLRVAVAAKPVNGKANQELLRYLSRALGIPRHELRIVSGARARLKIIDVPGATDERIREALP